MFAKECLQSRYKLNEQVCHSIFFCKQIDDKQQIWPYNYYIITLLCQPKQFACFTCLQNVSPDMMKKKLIVKVRNAYI